jgi:hypothetical protein
LRSSPPLCFCEIDQTPVGSELTQCTTVAKDPLANGWCYVDASEGPAEAALTSKCPAGDQHEIRFVGTGAPVPGSTLFLSCPG